MSGEPIRAALILGTRPEAVKLVPVVRELAGDERFAPRLVLTGQQRRMVDEVLEHFGVVPDVDLDIMRPEQSLNDIAVRLIEKLDVLYRHERFDLVVVQGDTSSALGAALAAFHRRIPVAHVEAGLRSHDRFHPFPEEVNRRMISSLADLHLAPTERAAENLRAEGVPDEAIAVTGNPVVDSLLAVLGNRAGQPPVPPSRTVLVTLHRREAWDAAEPADAPLEDILAGVAAAARAHPSVEFVYPVFLNPRVRRPAARVLDGIANLRLVEPVPYARFVAMMASATAIVTDSGGIQEEAASLGVPVLVARKTTERPEGLDRGTNRLVGTSAAAIAGELAALLARPPAAARAIPYPNPFGDGQAARRIRQSVLHYFGRGPRPDVFHYTPPRKGDGA